MGNTIGERLTELRVKFEMTQEDFAEYVGVSRQSVSKWELDKTFPDVEKLVKIAELYHTSLDYLVRGIDVEASKEVSDEENIDTEIEDVIEEPAPKLEEVRTNKKIKIASILLGVVCVVLVCIIVFVLFNRTYNKDNYEKTLVRVNGIHTQYSLVDLAVQGEDGKVIEKTVFMDTEGIREGDYIYAYVDDDSIKTDYEASTILIPIFLLIFMTIVEMLLIGEIKKL